jgi:hypothetical protein
VGRPRKRWTADVGTGDSPIPWSGDEDDDDDEFPTTYTTNMTDVRIWSINEEAISIHTNIE